MATSRSLSRQPRVSSRAAVYSIRQGVDDSAVERIVQAHDGAVRARRYPAQVAIGLRVDDGNMTGDTA
jgi:hypothetical protein